MMTKSELRKDVLFALAVGLTVALVSAIGAQWAAWLLGRLAVVGGG